MPFKKGIWYDEPSNKMTCNMEARVSIIEHEIDEIRDILQMHVHYMKQLCKERKEKSLLDKIIGR